MRPAPEVKVGLRFRRGDARLLQSLAARAGLRELGKQHVGLFVGAARSAETGEPLIIRCTNPIEADVIAQGFVNFGVHRPTLEELSGTLN